MLTPVSRLGWVLGAGLATAIAAPAAAQNTDKKTAPSAQGPAAASATTPAGMAERIDAAAKKGVELLLQMQEGEAGKPRAEWPYEGVYRVNNTIPIGYRVGGTGIVTMALLQIPGYKEDQSRKDAVHRAVEFINASTSHELMNPDYDGGYDVRGWGYTYGLQALLALKNERLIDADQADAAEKTIRWFIKAIEKTEIPQVGGWNYARQAGKDAVSPPSPFMTGPTLQALFAAKAAGYDVDEGVVSRAIATLEGARTPTGSYVYAGKSRDENPEPTPGAVGRMLVSEVTLHLCGKSDVARIRGALDAFFMHWEWLEKRRAKTGTHIPPYNIAPYYFYYAHFYAAQAIEYLPKKDREEYRRRLVEIVFKTQLEDGSWNDRVFPRSKNFGTAMSLMALLMPEARKPDGWKTAAK